MVDTIINFTILVFGLYWVLIGLVLLIAPRHIHKDPLWRLSFAFTSQEVEDLMLKFAKPLGAIAMSAGILLVILTLQIIARG